MNAKTLLLGATAYLLLAAAAFADDWQYWSNLDEKPAPTPGLLAGPPCLSARFKPLNTRAPPCSPHDYEVWLTDARRQRAERRIRVGLDTSRYESQALQWAQSSFIQPQMMAHERFLYDPSTGRYTVDRYLDDVTTRYGGIDSVLVWPTYPNMGIDDRNQLDLIGSMPGGLEGVKEMIAAFHRRHVRVFFPMMMWDQGTRDPGTPWPEAIAQLMRDIDADGVNGDTQDGVPRSFVEAADKTTHPLVFEPEISYLMADEAIAYNLMSWGYYDYQFVPLIDRHKWLEPRHMVNVCDRNAKDKTDNLQFAFFNGIGWESWENVWGVWNGITPRDAEATRRVASIERAVAPFLTSQDWAPFAPMLQDGVFASRWPLGDQVLSTIVNRNSYDVAGPQMEASADTNMRYFDLYHGEELQPVLIGGRRVVSVDLEAKGYGAVLESKSPPNGKVADLMVKMRAMTKQPLASLPHQWTPLSQQIIPVKMTAPEVSNPGEMVKIPSGNFHFKVDGVEIEGTDDAGVDVQYPWENVPRRYHDHVLQVKSFWIDKYPVTNLDFSKFMQATHYRPKDDLNFLRDWKDGKYPDGWANRPVTWVSREDAQAYAAWAGKRLPHEWEWQYAAQGSDGRVYPWGDEWTPTAVPVPDKGRTMRGPDEVTAHPDGASPFGVMDLVGNIWQWTDEFVDAHTRAAILRGGSYYSPQGSMWYFPQAYKLNEHGKLLQMAPSLDRSGAIGFRCVRDSA